MGTLKLYQVERGRTIIIMNVTGDQGNQWHYWETNFNTSKWFQVQRQLKDQ
jgi:hypothetical protein